VDVSNNLFVANENTQVKYMGPRAYMSSYIEEKYKEMKGVF